MTTQQPGGTGGTQESAETIRQQLAKLEKASPRDEAAISDAKRRLKAAEDREAAEQ